MVGVTHQSASFAEVKEEVRSVLASSAFKQSPALTRLLQYLCSKAVLEDPQQITEYTIAVDVFGKPPNFKDSKDAIVRVEMHRLRKRLAQFYEGEGENHRVKILIPPGQYVPEFKVSGTSLGEIDLAPAAEPLSVAPLVEAASTKAPATFPFAAVGACLLILTVIVVGFFLANPSRFGYAVSPGAADKREVRIRAGLTSGSYVDGSGKAWLADRYYKGGVSRPGPKNLIPRPPDHELFQTMREGNGSGELLPDKRSFSYNIPLKRGTYDLRLYFADPFYENPSLEKGQDAQNVRRFRVTANGRPLLEQFDAVADAGIAAVDVRAFKNISPAEDGLLHLEFLPDPHLPFVNALELMPSIGGKANPIRICARQSAYTDREGKTWSADNYYIRGRMIQHSMPYGAPKLPGLYSAERYGNFSYAIPVPQGVYAVTLHFAETMFTPFAASTICRGQGCRVFDVTCNGVLLLRDFDIFQAADGAFRPVARTFHGLRPNGQGKLLLSFSPSVNYGEIRAIEVLDETP